LAGSNTIFDNLVVAYFLATLYIHSVSSSIKF